LWKPMTSATIAHEYRKVLTKWQDKTDKEKNWFIDWQGHDFSMRGMDSIDATVSSGLGHLTSFLGTDSLPSISGARKYYGETEFVGGSVNATEHSVMCAGGSDDEIGTFRRLIETYPTGILSIVSDTWDLWKVCTEHVVTLKEEILARDGKLVIRPDSGDPVDIICGKQDGVLRFIHDYPDNEDLEWESVSHFVHDNYQNNIEGTLIEIKGELYEVGDFKYMIEEYGWENGVAEIVNDVSKMLANGVLIKVDKPIENINESKGVIELLWDVFGGTVNEQGYKILDSHIGAIYGDSITIDRADEICARLEAKGFASTNVVLGIGSFTYQYNTRDTFGFAMKATYVELTTSVGDSGIGEVGLMDKQVTVGREIFKDPITDDGTKKSATGLLCVTKHTENNYMLVDKVSWAAENNGELQTIYKDGKFYKQTTLTEIRNRLKQ
jgi:nicotinamide phosphoribosyltransferase